MDEDVDESTDDVSPSFNQRSGTYHVHHDDTANQELSTTVVYALVAVSSVEPEDVDLNAVVHPDCLNRIFSRRANGRARIGGRLTFPLADHTITVHADGEVVIDPPDPLTGGNANQ